MPPVDKPKHKRRVPTQGQRGKFSNEVRQDIYTRANGICEYCQCRQGIEVHHVKPKSRAGRGVYTNGILLCRGCHTKAHKSELVMQELIQIHEQKYGKNFYKDEYDLKQ